MSKESNSTGLSESGQDDKVEEVTHRSTTKPPPPAPEKKARPQRDPASKRSEIDRSLPPREQAKIAFQNPKQSWAKDAIEDSIQWVIRRYNEARRRAAVKPIMATAIERNRKHWRSLARWVCEEGIAIDQFFDFVYANTRWQNVEFPTPSVVAGDWARDEWEQKGSYSGGAGKAHAGAKYVQAERSVLDVAREIAEALGAAGLGDDTLEYLVEQAETLNSHPHHYSPDPEYGEIEKKIAQELRSSA